MAVVVQAGGTQRPLFVGPGVNANGNYARTISGALGDDYPVYTFARVARDGVFSEDIEDMAAGFVDELRAVQPTGPYRLLGFSFAAHVVYAMARALVGRGEQVEFLGVIDDDADVHRRCFDVEKRPRDSSDSFSAALFALDRKPLATYPGRITVFRGAYWTGMRRPGAAMDWEYFAEGGVDVFDVPCAHEDAVSPGGVESWAEQLAWALGARSGSCVAPPRHLASKAHLTSPEAKKGFACASRGDLAGEIESYERALAQAPEPAEWICINLAKALRQRGDVDAAIDALWRATAAASCPGNGHIELGRFLRDAARSEDLGRLATAVSDLPAVDGSDFYCLGEVLRLCGDFKGSEEAYRRVVAGAPRWVHCYHRLCELLVERKRFADAAEVVREGLKHSQGAPFLTTWLAELSATLGDDEAAERLFREVLQKDRRIWRATVRFATFLSQGGRLDEAIEVVTGTLQTNTGHYGMLNKLGELYVMAGRLDEAERAYGKSVAVWLDNPGGYIGLSRVREGQGRRDDALRGLQEALPLVTDQLWMRRRMERLGGEVAASAGPPGV